MANTFKVGDHVTWNMEAGHVSKGLRPSREQGQSAYEIKSDKTDHVVLHKGEALRLADRFATMPDRRSCHERVLPSLSCNDESLALIL
jgi:hypothetical protein